MIDGKSEDAVIEYDVVRDIYDVLYLELVVGTSMIEIMTETADKQSKSLRITEACSHQAAVLHDMSQSTGKLHCMLAIKLNNTVTKNCTRSRLFTQSKSPGSR